MSPRLVSIPRDASMPRARGGCSAQVCEGMNDGGSGRGRWPSGALRKGVVAGSPRNSQIGTGQESATAPRSKLGPPGESSDCASKKPRGFSDGKGRPGGPAFIPSTHGRNGFRS